MANVRNLVDALVEPADGMNVLEGANGQGKTNFLEGLYLLSGLRSFRGARFADVRGSGDSTFEIEARIATARGERHVRQCWSRQGRRAWIDDRLARGSSELLEQLPMVFFGPDDLQLVKGGPALRRAFLDEACVQIHPESSADLRRYTQVLRERNRLLRDAASGDHDATMLRVYTRTLAEAGQAVLGHRRRLMESLAPELEGTLDRMSGGLHKGSVALAPSSFISAGAPSEEEGFDVADRRALAAGTTVSGPHRSDLKLTFDGHEARGRASQGQIRLVVIAMKVALMQRITAQRDVVPVLLLDDVSSELDDTRSTHLSRYLYDAAGQVFATTTNAAAVGLDRADARFFAVDAGAVVRRERDVS